FPSSATPYYVPRAVCCSYTLPIFFCTVPSTAEIYTLSLHDALPIYDAGCGERVARANVDRAAAGGTAVRQSDREAGPGVGRQDRDRKSTRLNSSHVKISYAVFCLKKKNRRRRNNNQKKSSMENSKVI